MYGDRDMLFNSYIFIFLFLPLALLGFCLLKDRNPVAAKVWLIAVSLWFYGYFNLGYLAIMVCSILFNYAIYRAIVYVQKKSATEDEESTGSIVTAGQTPLIIGIAGNLGLLIYFKYTDFLLDSCNHVFKTALPLKHILLPLGISFFTFQQIGFLADAYRNELPAKETRQSNDDDSGMGEDDPKLCSFVDYALFVSFFPQLIAGPIADAQSMLPQYRAIGRKARTGGAFGVTTEAASSDYISPLGNDRILNGTVLFILGLSKKVLIADTFGKAVDYAYGVSATGIGSAEAFLTILFYALQLYFDFSGYCDMALGLGGMFGIDIPVNFDSPYKSRNIIEFWRRWHITLNKFLTKNVYIPLGGNRKGNVRTYVNLLIVFLISGIWHGAGVTFILWGCMHGLMYVITRAYMKFMEKAHKKESVDDGPDEAKESYKPCTGLLSRIITFIFVCIAWVFFRSPDVSTACAILRSTVTGGFGHIGDGFLEGFNSGEFWYALKILHLTNLSFSRYIIMVLFAIFGLGTALLAPNALYISKSMKRTIPNGIMLGILFIWSVLSLSGVSTFLYFNF